MLSARERVGLYFAVGLGAGAVIALQIDIMRVFAVGSWAHFGSLVVSLAMLGFGLTSAVMTIAKDWFSRHWRVAATVALGLFGPLAVGANLYVQQLGFNAIFLVSDPAQKWKLLQMFLAELTPFLAGAVFLGCVFLKSNRTFGRVYFADLAGCGSVRPRLPPGDVCVRPGRSDRGAAGSLACRVPRLGSWDPEALARSFPMASRACWPSAAILRWPQPWA